MSEGKIIFERNIDTILSNSSCILIINGLRRKGVGNLSRTEEMAFVKNRFDFLNDGTKKCLKNKIFR